MNTVKSPYYIIIFSINCTCSFVSEIVYYVTFEALTENKCAKVFSGDRHDNIEVKTNFSEISLVSVVRVSVVNDHPIPLIFIPVCPINAFLLVYYTVGGWIQTVWSPI
jgi:hypothetical protein